MFRTILVLLLVIGCASVALGDSAKPSKLHGYQPEITYTGLYKADRLYQHNGYVDAWYSSRTLRTVASLRCNDARRALANAGEWVGVLTESGACSGTAEGQRWVTGNYLNFLTSDR